MYMTISKDSKKKKKEKKTLSGFKPIWELTQFLRTRMKIHIDAEATSSFRVAELQRPGSAIVKRGAIGRDGQQGTSVI